MRVKQRKGPAGVPHYHPLLQNQAAWGCLLSEATMDYPDRRQWAEGGSKIYLWTEGDMREAIRYVLEEQGEPTEVYRPDD